MANKWAQIAGRWEHFAVEAKKQWEQLTDDEVAEVNGNRNALARIVQARYYISKKEAHTQIEAWVDDLKV